jgi:hypothetical protein
VYDIIFKEEVAIKICPKKDDRRMAMYKNEALMNKVLKENNLHSVFGYASLRIATPLLSDTRRVYSLTVSTDFGENESHCFLVFPLCGPNFAGNMGGDSFGWR